MKNVFRPYKSLLHHFRVRVKIIHDKTSCWEYQGAKYKHGYGNITYTGQNYGTLTHRVYYYASRGDFDKSLDVCHTCDNPSCCRPSHLFLGTHKQNMEDMSKKGRRGSYKNERSKRARLNWRQIHLIRKIYSERSCRRMDLALIFGISREHLHKIGNYQIWIPV